MGWPRPRRYTIGEVMALIAVLALLLAATQFDATRESTPFVAVLVLGALAFLAAEALIERLLGLRCPRCGRWSLRRLSRHPRGVLYYECSCCLARLKRPRRGAWQEATDPGDDPYYRPRRPEGSWQDPPTAETDESTQGQLLAGKLRRKAEEGADDDPGEATGR